MTSRQGPLGDAVMLYNRITQPPNSSHQLSSNRNISLYKFSFGWIKKSLHCSNTGKISDKLFLEVVLLFQTFPYQGHDPAHPVTPCGTWHFSLSVFNNFPVPSKTSELFGSAEVSETHVWDLSHSCSWVWSPDPAL